MATTTVQLYKFGERYYDPNYAIWTQRDVIAGTITDPKTLNRYAYVGGDPINYEDQTGLALSDSCAFNVGASVVGIVGTQASLGATLGLALAPEPGVTKVGAALSAARTVGSAVTTYAAIEYANRTCGKK